MYLAVLFLVTLLVAGSRAQCHGDLGVVALGILRNHDHCLSVSSAECGMVEWGCGLGTQCLPDLHGASVFPELQHRMKTVVPRSVLGLGTTGR